MSVLTEDPVSLCYFNFNFSLAMLCHCSGYINLNPSSPQRVTYQQLSIVWGKDGLKKKGFLHASRSSDVFANNHQVR